MLSKEEIEVNLKILSNVMLNFEDKLCDEMQERVKEVKEYIKQLETKNQKLIEKLEEIRKDMKQDQYSEIYYLQDIEEILEMLKGENDESNDKSANARKN